jgi:DNA-binding NtrC family response regulator
MAHILILENETRYRVLLRFILEGINHRVQESGDWRRMPSWEAGGEPDLVIVGLHLERESPAGDWLEWKRGLPDVPILILFSGDPNLKGPFLDSWTGPATFNFLAMVKAMITAPAEWRRGGQHTC